MAFATCIGLRWLACSAPTWLCLVPAMLPTQRNTTHTVRAMHEIICPHCSQAFKIDEAGYADILKQVEISAVSDAGPHGGSWSIRAPGRG